MKNYGNDGHQKADCENYGETINVSPLQERNIALTWVQLVKVYCGKLLLKLTVMTLYKLAMLIFIFC
jgi:hypothetical protein